MLDIVIEDDIDCKAEDTLTIKNLFGTDGVRGSVGTAPITPDFIARLGFVFGELLVASCGLGAKVIIGRDTRISGVMLESALVSGLIAAGVDVYILGVLPTSAVSYLISHLEVQAGIVVSASHNPYYDNGVKFFARDGRKISRAFECAIEQKINCRLDFPASINIGKSRLIYNAQEKYLNFCKQCFDIDLSGLKIIVDCANGAAYQTAPRILSALGAEVVEVATSPDGLNINSECGSTDLRKLQKQVVKEKADLGIALDGDADRVILIDHQGHVVDGDVILYIIAAYKAKNGSLQGGVVGTEMSNLGLQNAICALGVDFVRTSVGDKYVVDAMSKYGWQLGGESSGHIICADLIKNTGDGVLSALYVLEAMIINSARLAELASDLLLYPQMLVNIKVNGNSQDPMSIGLVREAVKKVEADLFSVLGGGRVLLRRSGTQPLVRIMVEGKDRQYVQKSARYLADIIKNTNLR